MQLNLSTDYALRILMMLDGKSSEGVSSLDISRHIGIEREFTLKILRALKQGGFVRANRGKTGGYLLAKPLDSISLFQLFNQFEDSMYVNRCLEPEHFCTQKAGVKDCSAHCFFLDLQEKTETILRNISIREVADGTYQL